MGSTCRVPQWWHLTTVLFDAGDAEDEAADESRWKNLWSKCRRRKRPAWKDHRDECLKIMNTKPHEARAYLAVIDMEDKLLSLTGINNILARGVVIHAGMDDMGKVSCEVSGVDENLTWPAVFFKFE